MGKVFKKSLMGFSKEQVIAYIDTLVDKQKAALEEEKEKYAQLQEENEKLTNERDNAVSAAREELQGELDALNEQLEAAKGEKDEIFVQLEDVKAENERLSESNLAIKAQLDEYINNEKTLLEKVEGLSNENHVLTIALEKEKSIGKIDISTYQAEIEELRRENAQLRAQFRTKTVVPAVQPKEENTEEVWESLKDKINGLATDFNDLANSVRAEETREAESKKISIKDILERVKRIGEKI